jgi:hypothetical protein
MGELCCYVCNHRRMQKRAAILMRRTPSRYISSLWEKKYERCLLIKHPVLRAGRDWIVETCNMFQVGREETDRWQRRPSIKYPYGVGPYRKTDNRNFLCRPLLLSLVASAAERLVPFLWAPKSELKINTLDTTCHLVIGSPFVRL